MYIGQEALWQSIRLVLDGRGINILSPWLVAFYFHLFVTLLAADYKQTNNGYNESVCMRFLQNLMKREGKSNCHWDMFAQKHPQPYERKVTSSSSF